MELPHTIMRTTAAILGLTLAGFTLPAFAQDVASPICYTPSN